MESLKRAAAPYLLSRILVFVLLIIPLLVSVQPIPTQSDAGMVYHLQPADSATPLLQRLSTLLHSADGAWYQDIAENGYTPLPPEARHDPVSDYTGSQRNWAFFPLYPLLERFLSPLAGSVFRAGLICTFIFFFGALVLLDKLAGLSQLSPAGAERALWLLALYPFSYFFSFPLTESLFLFLSIAAFLLVAVDRPIAAGAAMALASATRPTGLLLIPAFAWELYRSIRSKKITVLQSAAALILAPLGAALFSWYLELHTGNFMAFSLVQKAWGRADFSIGGLISALLSPINSVSAPWNMVLLNAMAAYLSIACAVWAVLNKRIGWALIILVPLVFSLGTGITQSFGRFSAVSFPIFLILAEVSKRPAIEKIILAVFAALLGALTIGRAFYVTSVMC